jgi:hypothetical protein
MERELSPAKRDDSCIGKASAFESLLLVVGRVVLFH